MKTLVIFYSLEGNCELIATKLQQAAEADLLQLYPQKGIPTKGVGKFLIGGWQAIGKAKPALQPFESPLPLDAYDLVFIGTPVWAGNFAPALRSFLAGNKLENKNIALFCCNDGGGGKIFEKLKVALPGNRFVGEKEFVSPRKTGPQQAVETAGAWAADVLKKAEADMG